MIELTKLDNDVFFLNPDKFEKLEEVPHTVITLSNGKKYIVKEDANTVINKVIIYKRKIFDKKTVLD